MQARQIEQPQREMVQLTQLSESLPQMQCEVDGEVREPDVHARPGANMSVWGLGLEPWYIHPNNIVDNQSLPPPPPPGPLGRATRVQGRRLQQSVRISPASHNEHPALKEHKA